MGTFLPRQDPFKAQRRYHRFSQVGRISIGSEYVVHIDEGGNHQVLFMKFQDMPTDAEQFGLDLVASGPMLYGLVAEFNSPPKQYRDAQANARSAPRGSRFVVRARLYDVKKVDTNHLGGVQMQLTHSKGCDVRDLSFADEIRPYLCLPEQD